VRPFFRGVQQGIFEEGEMPERDFAERLRVNTCALLPCADRLSGAEILAVAAAICAFMRDDTYNADDGDALDQAETIIVDRAMKLVKEGR
jgi:hypothetical protein